jgi:hypothetical protein
MKQMSIETFIFLKHDWQAVPDHGHRIKSRKFTQSDSTSALHQISFVKVFNTAIIIARFVYGVPQ